MSGRCNTESLPCCCLHLPPVVLPPGVLTVPFAAAVTCNHPVTEMEGPPVVTSLVVKKVAPEDAQFGYRPMSVRLAAATLQDLTVNDIGSWPEGALAAFFSTRSTFPALRVLELGSTYFGKAVKDAAVGAAIAASCPLLKTLRVGTKIDAGFGSALSVASDALPELISVTCSLQGVDDLVELASLLRGRSLDAIELHGWIPHVSMGFPGINGTEGGLCVDAILGCERLPAKLVLETTAPCVEDCLRLLEDARAATDVRRLWLPALFDIAAVLHEMPLLPALSELHLTMGMGPIDMSVPFNRLHGLIPVYRHSLNTWVVPPVLTTLSLTVGSPISAGEQPLVPPPMVAGVLGAVAASPAMTTLADVRLWPWGVDAGLEAAVAALGNAPALRSLRIGGLPPVTLMLESGRIDRIRESLPQVEVVVVSALQEAYGM